MFHQPIGLLTDNAKEMTKTCSPVVRHSFDTITEVSTEKEFENSSLKVRILKESRLETYHCEPP